jgi:hypothetical protein
MYEPKIYISPAMCIARDSGHSEIAVPDFDKYRYDTGLKGTVRIL